MLELQLDISYIVEVLRGEAAAIILEHSSKNIALKPRDGFPGVSSFTDQPPAICTECGHSNDTRKAENIGSLQPPQWLWQLQCFAVESSAALGNLIINPLPFALLL